MGIVRTGESDFDKELEKWEQSPRGSGGPNPKTYRPFPKMVYKAMKLENGKIERVERLDRIVPDEEGLQRALKEGYGLTPDEAVEIVQGFEEAIADAAANRAFHDQKMSAKARAEAEAADEATAHHVPEVPETPIKKRSHHAAKGESS